jgi:hypothetical protein
MYPFRIRIVDPELERIMNRLAKDRTVTMHSDKSYIRKLSWKVKPIRKDIFIGFDTRTYDSNISLKNPQIRIEKIGKDFVFKI